MLFYSFNYINFDTFSHDAKGGYYFCKCSAYHYAIRRSNTMRACVSILMKPNIYTPAIKNKSVFISVWCSIFNWVIVTGFQLGHTLERCLLSFCHWSLSIQSRFYARFVFLNTCRINLNGKKRYIFLKYSNPIIFA